MEIDVIVSLPNGDRTQQNEYNEMIKDMESFGSLVKSDMGAFGYRFLLEVPKGTNSKQLKLQINDMLLDYYGLEVEQLWDDSGYVY